jgi:hypothetical protein
VTCSLKKSQQLSYLLLKSKARVNTTDFRRIVNRGKTRENKGLVPSPDK